MRIDQFRLLADGLVNDETIDEWTDPNESDVSVMLLNERKADGRPLACDRCGEPATYEQDGEPVCAAHLDAEEDHEPLEPPPLAWVNFAGVSLDTEHDRVVLSVSIGDPRGALNLTVERKPDGRIFVGVPSPDDPQPHVELQRQFSDRSTLVCYEYANRFWRRCAAFRAEMLELVTARIAEIGDDDRATDEDTEPGMQLTIATDDDLTGWASQTGDNSFTGPAYGFPRWAVVYLSRDSEPESVVYNVFCQWRDLLDG